MPLPNNQLLIIADETGAKLTEIGHRRDTHAPADNTQ